MNRKIKAGLFAVCMGATIIFVVFLRKKMPVTSEGDEIVSMEETKEAINAVKDMNIETADSGKEVIASETVFETKTEKEIPALESERIEEDAPIVMPADVKGSTEDTEAHSSEMAFTIEETKENFLSSTSETMVKDQEDDSIGIDTRKDDLETSPTELDLEGDSLEGSHYPFNREHYAAIILNLSDPEWYQNEDREVMEYLYNRVYALSDRYKNDHPFSEGSILKPYFPDIDRAYFFTVSFEDREVVIKAYDTTSTKRFFLINFTITDDYKLDTVSIRELTDDEVVD